MSTLAENAEIITGTVRRFIYRSGDFGIFRLDNAVALGDVPGVREGDLLTVSGRWETHPVYGRRFRVESWEKPVPTDRDTAVEFLSSGLIKGVGRATAEKIVDALGPNAVKKIVDDPDALKKVKGIGKKAPEIRRQLQETYHVQNAVGELMKFGLTYKTAMKAYREFGFPAVEYVRKNPYCLVKLDRIGFHRADSIAANLGISPDSPFRVKAALEHALDQAVWQEGHTCLPEEELVARAAKLLELPPEKVEPVLGEDFVFDGGLVAPAWAHVFEREIARDVKRLLSRRHRPPETIDPAGVKLTPAQEAAVRTALSSGISTLTGGPGVGKTQTVRAVVATFLKENPGGKVVLCAPTGRAARRLSELTGHPAHTIHKLLGLRGKGAVFDRSNPLECDLLIVDETSMAGIVMTKRLMEAVPDHCRVLFVGDVDQLPSVEPGNVLRDVLDKVPTARLTEVFRQAAESLIVTNAHRVNRGRMPLIDRYRDDFVLLEREDPKDVARCVKTWVENLPYGPSEVQVLSPMKKGPLGAVELNRLLQGEKPAPKVARGRFVYHAGDKVIHTKNNYVKGVMNGEIGVVEEIRETGDGPVLFVRYNGDLVAYARDDLDELEPAAAVTCHKLQGSEFKCVVAVVHPSHYVMLFRSLLYTAITRAREKLILVGSKKALAMAVGNDRPVRRHTLLCRFLD
jgi:exodeoxyribonuclease V alpha subunit